MVLSYHPVLRGDVNRLCAGRDPSETDFSLMKRAKAILLPQGCSERLWLAASRYCRRFFPNYTFRFHYPGKIGDIRLFRNYGFPHPKSWLFSSVQSCPKRVWESVDYPLVIKSNHGGEGSAVFWVRSPEAVAPILEMLRGMERAGFCGFIVQQWVPNDGRDLRVAVIGRKILSYWRVQPRRADFYHNLARGAVIDQESDPHLQRLGIDLVKRFVGATGINLAGFDLLFPCRRDSVQPTPLLLEINYYFGRKGLGGSENFYRLLQEAADEWLREQRLAVSAK